MPSLESFSGLFEKMKKIVKSKDLTPGPAMKTLSKVQRITSILIALLMVFVASHAVAGTLFSDDFTDGVITGWANLSGSAMVESGGVFWTGGPNINTHYKVDSDSGWTDYTLTVDVKGVDNDISGITFRVQDSNNYYIFRQGFGDNDGWNLRIQKVVGGSATDLATAINNYGTNPGQVSSLTTYYQFKVVLSGTSIQCYIDNVLKFDITDSTYASGTVGVWLSSQDSSEFDNVVVTDSSSNSAPNPPTIDTFNTGSCTTDTTPDLQFDLSDPDSGDIVKYKIQIDNDSDFSSPVVDYTEPTGSAEPRSNLIYTPSPLSTGQYYWRVRAIDDEPAEGVWATANSGSVAFLVDNDTPAAPGDLTYNSKSPFSVTLNFGSQTTDDNFDTYKIFYKQGSSGVTESDTEHTDSNLGYIDYNLASTTTIGGLLPNTQYVFNIWAYDVCGKKASATEVSVTTDQACFTVRDKSQGSGTTADVIVDKPPLTAEGDLMIVTAIHDAADGNLTASGWNLIEPAVHSGTQMRTRSWYKVAG
ncbi:MAG: hypothetical protein JSW12_12540, partial [Deltaproteobacteria bacterium]